MIVNETPSLSDRLQQWSEADEVARRHSRPHVFIVQEKAYHPDGSLYLLGDTTVWASRDLAITYALRCGYVLSEDGRGEVSGVKQNDSEWYVSIVRHTVCG